MEIRTTVGPIWLKASAQGLTEISFKPLVAEENEKDNPHLQLAKNELLAYFNQQLKEFTVPLDIQVGTLFQKEVWHALLAIPYGETCCYQEIAEKIQRPKAIRAIGQANRRNPLPIIIPCHRVIGKNGKMTGYMGTEGITIKEQLLTLEGFY
ncbi:methylated-DNA-[protein]-cysteine S-methyltransferase [Enterococcus sp. PF1-24]|uniref:methylated-DNA--[protein]-cysteine S-methyltransferase n=1 Tax=unclassified Enterococcus TaxID=2608891 RepID=UPI0024754B81|nr:MULTISPECIES: methylated-DNA--[protein]-cysteine S-methyltransferase [unclassified Enterococcus]MDH6364592.1 methylated-DNA-[protein]-cysteine S-methyltransferase [Enterococcus sp. PFB1-1]MDH6401693.1 methylated-DNA-[protein]-cysteine S-methyltransferase [Enterococcus sp. PF1-24]